MTETQAKSGGSGASTNPVDEGAAGGGPATGRAAVGRATVPADAPSPKFTRAPGMPPPPDQPGDQPDTGAESSGDGVSPTAAGAAKATPAPAPVIAPPAGPGKTPGMGRSSGQQSSGQQSSGQQSSGQQSPGQQSSGQQSSGQQSPGPGVGGRGTAGVTSPGAGSATATQPIPDRGVAGGSFRFAPGTSRPGGAGGRSSGAAASAASAVTGAAAVGAARVTEAVRAARSSVGSAASRGPRRARLNVKRIDPWSVMKFSFAVSLVLFIVVIVATSVLYLALDAMGVFESVNSSLTDLVSAGGGQDGGDTFRITAKGVILTSALIGLVNVVLFTALATLGAFVYNVCADLVGGIELTLAERD